MMIDEIAKHETQTCIFSALNVYKLSGFTVVLTYHKCIVIIFYLEPPLTFLSSLPAIKYRSNDRCSFTSDLQSNLAL